MSSFLGEKLLFERKQPVQHPDHCNTHAGTTNHCNFLLAHSNIRFVALLSFLEIVRLLLRLVPSCSSVFTNKSKLALHFSCGEGHLQICRELLKVHPNGAILPSKKGKLAIHFAARYVTEKRRKREEKEAKARNLQLLRVLFSY